MIIEAVTRNTLAHELTTRLLQPLELNNTFYLPLKLDEQQLKRMAHGYSKKGIFSDEPHDITNYNFSWASAAGGIVTNSNELAIWFRHLMRGTILPKTQMSELTQTIPTNGFFPNASPENSYGLGIMHDPKLFDKDIWWHSGTTLGYSTLMLWLKESDIVITLTLNQIDENSSSYHLMESIVKVLTTTAMPTHHL
jgi:D-alanyl-D-alanine carboxypeptidase